MDNKYIGIDEVIANASTFIEDISDELSLIMRQWVWMALKDIGPNFSDIQTAELEIVGGSIVKPSDMIGNFIDLGIYTSEGHEIPYRYNYNNSRTHLDSTRRRTMDIYEDFGFLHMSDFDSATPDYVVAKYFSMPLDDCGMPKIPESYLNAVVAYLKFCYYYRQGNRSDMVMISKNHWMEERLKIRAKNKSVAGLRAEQMVKDWMTHIPRTGRKRF